MTQIYDAIIIGGGHNGLVTATYLAKAGLDVLLLERREVLGGAAATEQIFPDFRFDTGAPDAGLFRQELVQELELEKYGLEFLESDVAVFAPQPDGTALTLWQDIERSKREISRYSKVDAAKFASFTAKVRAMTGVLGEILELTPPDLTDLSPGEIWPWLQIGWKLRRSGREEMMEFLRVLPLSIRDYLDEWFESDALKGVLGLPAISGGLPGPFAAGTTLMFLYQQLGGMNGGYRSGRYVRGGLGNLSSALANAAQDHGVTIRSDAGVDDILLDQDRARGVVLGDGEAIGSQLVVSSLDPRRTFFKLVGGAHLMPNFIREVRNIRYRGTIAKVNLALSSLPNFTGAEDDQRLRGFIAISPSLEYLERAWDDAKYGQISARPVLELTIPTLLDSTLAPKENHVMSITMQYAPYHLREMDWNEQRERLGDVVIKTLSQYAPGLSDLILHRQVITPLDWEREYGLTEGCIFHGRMELDQLLFMRPLPGYARYRTPIENLYLCGAGTHPGGGVTGAPGYNAAREILKDWQ